MKLPKILQISLATMSWMPLQLNREFSELFRKLSKMVGKPSFSIYAVCNDTAFPTAASTIFVFLFRVYSCLLKITDLCSEANVGHHRINIDLDVRFASSLAAGKAKLTQWLN